MQDCANLNKNQGRTDEQVEANMQVAMVVGTIAGAFAIGMILYAVGKGLLSLAAGM